MPQTRPTAANPQQRARPLASPAAYRRPDEDAKLVSSDEKTGDVKTGDVKTGDVKTGDVKTGEVKTGDVKTGGTLANQTFTHPGFDSPDAAFDGYLQAVDRKDTGAVRSMM